MMAVISEASPCTTLAVYCIKWKYNILTFAKGLKVDIFRQSQKAPLEAATSSAFINNVCPTDNFKNILNENRL